MIYKTPNDIFKNRPPRKDSRKNEYKIWREGVVAAKFCEVHKWDSALIGSPEEDRGDDVIIKYNDCSYPFQITEMAPKDPSVSESLPKFEEKEDGVLLSGPYAELDGPITKRICALIQNKNKKHYPDQEKMNLLIYVNPNIAVFDRELDLDENELIECAKSSRFKTISLYTNSEDVIFIKGDRSALL